MIVGKPSVLKNGNDFSFAASFAVVATPEGKELHNNKNHRKSNTKKIEQAYVISVCFECRGHYEVAPFYG